MRRELKTCNLDSPNLKEKRGRKRSLARKRAKEKENKENKSEYLYSGRKETFSKNSERLSSLRGEERGSCFGEIPNRDRVESREERNNIQKDIYLIW